MSITKQDLKQRLEAGDIQGIFVKLGWNRSSGKRPLKLAEGDIVQAELLAEKKDFFVAVVKTTEPTDKARRQKIEKQFTKFHAEHLLVYLDAHGGQVWQLAVRRPQQPIAYHEVPWHKGQKPELLYQKLTGLFVSLDEEDSITVIDVTDRARRQFEANTKKVVKKFYKEFGVQHKAFVKFIKGLDATADKEWYASLMLNRLMFIYFIQKKGFLNKDPDYLRTKLNESRTKRGDDRFYQGFYRSFLLRLFHEGLGGSDHAHLAEEIGRVPYLNGGLFDVHPLETPGSASGVKPIDIGDEAFEKLFDFFDGWQWTLDIRSNAPGNEVNPDVIGYIFEQYINERAKMGAYYTQEDITHYIGRNTIIPWLFDKAKEKDAQAFRPEGGVWALLQDNPDHYIYESVQKGITSTMREALDAEDPSLPWWQSSLFADLPSAVREGLDPEQKDLWKIRKAWNTKAPEDIALPTEIYRELIDRRRRYLELHRMLKAGEVTAINELITHNLDIVEFAQDVLRDTESGDLVWAFYDAIQQVTVLDPTCGSGAFLFGALNILQPLYTVCLQRMAEFRQQAKAESKPQRYKQFQPILDDVATQPSPRYYTLKSIILRNLYGVDIMPEAVEIAKLRLFLKLVSVLEPDYDHPNGNMGIEPLPDIDFNIRAGNTLVGFGTKAELDKGLEYTMDGLLAKPVIEEKCDMVAKAFEHFKAIQLGEGQDYASFRAAKDSLQQRLAALREELDRYLGKQYGKDADHSVKQYAAWKASHKPFHWFAEYYGIVEGRGGFDVIIGNPPYLEVRQIDYEPNGLSTLESNAVHSMCIERSAQVLNTEHGSMAMIVPLSIVCTQRMVGTQSIIESGRTTWYSNFAWRPGKLFDAVNRALTIYVTRAGDGAATFSTGYIKWNSDAREDLFPNVAYQEVPLKRPSFFVPKHQSPIEGSILMKILTAPRAMAQEISSQGGKAIYYRTTGGLYWKVFTDFAPAFELNGKPGSSSRETWFSLRSADQSDRIVALLGSSLFWWWYTITANLRDLNPTDISGFRFPDSISKDAALSQLGKAYLKDLKKNSTMLVRSQKTTGKTSTQSFKISLSKPLLDEIDVLLGAHYGLSEEELDFVINYDIKYRMGLTSPEASSAEGGELEESD